jgi:hypothetical protein
MLMPSTYVGEREVLDLKFLFLNRWRSKISNSNKINLKFSKQIEDAKYKARDNFEDLKKALAK